MQKIGLRLRIGLRALACVACVGGSVASAQSLTDEGSTLGDHTEGHAVALWGDVLAVGAPNMEKPGFPSSIPAAGAVKIYVRNAQQNGWALAQTIFSPNPATENHFGSSVALRDGFLVVGESGYGTAGVEKRGRILAYVGSGSPIQFTYRQSQPGHSIDQFAGSALAIEQFSNDGPYIVLSGAPGGQGPSDASKFGGAYASAWDASGNLLGSTFVDPVQIGIPTAIAAERFGAAVAIAPQKCVPAIACQNTYFIAIGYPGYSVPATSAGGAMVLRFVASQDFDNWTFDNVQGVFWDETRQIGESFGSAVAIDPGDGMEAPTRLVVGIPGAVNLVSQSTGAVRIFERNVDSGAWVSGDEIYAPGGASATNAQLGKAVSILGNRIWAGAPFYDVQGTFGSTGDAGAVFELDRLADNTWILANELDAAPPLNSAFLGFSLAYDARRLVAGAVGHDRFNTWIDCGSGDTIFCSWFED